MNGHTFDARMLATKLEGTNEKMMNPETVREHIGKIQESLNEISEEVSSGGGRQMPFQSENLAPVEHAPYVVTLGDGETRIAHRSGAKIYTAVIAILGLERLNDEPYLPNSTVSVVCTTPQRRLISYAQYGRYYVFKDMKIDKQKESLEHLASKLGVGLIIE